MYTYLTGSASWYMLTLVSEVFGVRGVLGDLVLEPKLVAGQFDPESQARLVVHFADKELDIIYQNHALLEYGAYRISSVRLDDRNIKIDGFPVIIPRSLITSLSPGMTHHIYIELSS
jgi:cellobiose phosphorylase